MLPVRSAAALLALAAAVPAAAQTVIFEEDFETDVAGRWSVDGLWHRARTTNACLQSIAPFPSDIYAMWFGVQASCDFNSNQWVGDVTMLQTVHLPAAANDALLSFWSYDDVECDTCGWDWRFVYLSDDGGLTWTQLGESDKLLNWYQVGFDLTPWLGEDVLIRLHFDAVDFWLNDGLGWVVDDLRITVDACSTPPQNFCIAAPNSVGPGATIGYTGTTSVAADDFHLTMTGAPPKQFTHFFYGPQESAPIPLADGFRCVAPGAASLVRLLPPAQIDANGALDVKLDIPASLNTPNWITPGSTWLFQCWYRDPMGPGGNGSNVSDALRVTFCN